MWVAQLGKSGNLAAVLLCFKYSNIVPRKRQVGNRCPTVTGHAASEVESRHGSAMPFGQTAGAVPVN